MARGEPPLDYQPGIVPDDPASLSQFLSDELNRIAAAVRPRLSYQGQLYLGADPIELNPGGWFVNYTGARTWDGARPEMIDPVTGIITIPFPGLWDVSAQASGVVTDPVQNESIALVVEINELDGITVPVIVSANDIAAQRNDFRAWSGNFTSEFDTGDQLRMGIDQSASDMGFFEPSVVSFSIELDL